jgi:ATP/maltotriose-dependent transcriptional regulator MalT
LEGKRIETLAGQSKTAPRYERRIVQRSRLLEILDGVQQRTVLLVAPAGYGKTTLARQWLDRVGGAWVNVTPASVDVPVLARDLTSAIASVGQIDAVRVETALTAARTPDDQARAVSRTIVAELPAALEPWVVVDDYHLLMSSPAAEELVFRLERSGRFRFLITSRSRPTWATSRGRVYLETFELGAAELALDEAEVAELLPPDRRTLPLRKQARGWAAVIALAAHSQLSNVPFTADSLSATLYDYFAEELFDLAANDVQRCLMAAALLPPLSDDELAGFAETNPASAKQVVGTGLAYEADGRIEVHPLARAFLLAKVRESEDRVTLPRRAFELDLARGLYDEAFELVAEHRLDDGVERLIVNSYQALAEAGRMATLQRFARYAETRGAVSSAILDLVGAEAQLRDGHLARAQMLASSAADLLEPGHPLKARCYLVAGHAAHLRQRHREARDLFRLSGDHAVTDAASSDAAWGRCLAVVNLEDADVDDVITELEEVPDIRPVDRLRLETAWLTFMRLRGLGSARNDLSGLAPQVADPWARSAWEYCHGYSLLLQARYGEAATVLRDALSYLAEFRLSFGMPHVEWSLAAAELGLRHFARTEALLQRIERTVGFSQDLHLQLNIRVLRARVSLVQQRPVDAVVLTADDFDEPPSPAMYGEYLGTRALALAALGNRKDALSAAEQGEETTACLEAKILCAATRAVLSLETTSAPSACAELLALASSLGAWDGVVCAVRAVPPLLGQLILTPRYRTELREVMVRANDHTLAKSVKKNAEIAASLFITVGTVKRHLDHIYDKLGARSRSEAVARYADIEIAVTGDPEL